MSETEEKAAEQPPRRSPIVGTSTLLVRLHRWIHTTPVEGCEGCIALAKLRAEKEAKT